MAITLAPVWQVDGKSLPRNPDSFQMKWDKANVNYEKQADGQQKRVQAPKLQTAFDYTLTWKYCPRRIIRAILQYCNQTYPLPGPSHSVTIDGIQPPLIIKCWFDTPEIMMSKDNYTTRTGEGGTFQDLTLNLRSDGRGFQSLYNVPVGTPSQASVSAWFGGVIGNTLDNLPIWNGIRWYQSIASTNTFAVSNLGNQEWFPSIIFNGPFASVSLSQTTSDVDGTGKGVQFTWTGGSVTSGNYLLFDTFQLRCYTVASTNAKTEVYTFSVNTVSDSQPFGFWPGLIPGNNSFSTSASGSLSGATSVDFSNNGQERFSYWS